MADIYVPLRVSWAVMNPAAVGKIQLMDARHAVGTAFAPGATAVSKRGGMLPGSNTPGAVTATSPTPDNFVRVAPFQCVLPSSRALAGAVAAPPYEATNDRTVAFNAFSTPPSAVANRRDLIVLQQNDTSQGDADSEANLRYVVGNAPAADPPVSGSPDYVILAQVVVRQNAVSVLQTDITPRVPAGFLTVAVGGLLPVANQAERDAISAYDGMTVFRLDKVWSEVRVSGGWRVLGVATVSAFASLAADITNPYTGQLACVSGEGRYYKYTGAAWAPVAYSTVQVFAANGNWNKPAGLQLALVELVGGGGSGGGAQATAGNGAIAGGGGGGGYARKLFLASDLAAIEAVVVGAGGAAAAAGANNGNAGGTSSFSTLSGTGGGGGVSGIESGAVGVYRDGGAGGVGAGGDINIPGDPGGVGISNGGVLYPVNTGGRSVLGAASGVAVNTSGVAGKQYGGGSSGASNVAGANPARASLAGAVGRVIVTNIF